MKTEQPDTAFQPIVITLETKQEAELFYGLFSVDRSHYKNVEIQAFRDHLYNWFYNKARNFKKEI